MGCYSSGLFSKIYYYKIIYRVEVVSMKLNKKVFGMFLGLITMLPVSVSATKNNNKFERFIKRMDSKIENNNISTKELVMEYAKNNSKENSNVGKEKFDESKDELLNFYRQRIEKIKSDINSKEELCKKLEEYKEDEEILREVIDLKEKESEEEKQIIEETVKEKGLTEQQKENLGREIEDINKKLGYIKKLNKKEELSSKDKDNLKGNLKTDIEMGKSNLEEVEKLKLEIENAKFDDINNKIDKTDVQVGFIYKGLGMEGTKDEAGPNFEKNLQENKTSAKHRLAVYIAYMTILERNNIILDEEEEKGILSAFCSFNMTNPEKITGLTTQFKLDKDKIEKINNALTLAEPKDIEITREIFEKRKKEFLKYYEEHVNKIEPSYNEWKEVIEKDDDSAIIGLMIKENKEMLREVEEKLLKGNLKGNELEFAKRDKEFLSKRIEKLEKDVKLDKNEKESLKENLNIQKSDYSGLKNNKEAVEKLTYEEVKELNKDLVFDKSLSECRPLNLLV